MCREPVGEGAKRVTTAGVEDGEVMAGVIAPTPAKPRLAERSRSFLSDQVAAQTLRWRMWTPVAFGGGCAVYFALKAEPPVWPLLVATVMTAGLWLGARRLALGRVWTLPLLMLACFALGVAVAKLRTEAVTAPIAPAMAEPTVVEGWVVDVDSPGSAGPRVVIAPVRIRGLAPEQTPVRLRATVRGEAPAPWRVRAAMAVNGMRFKLASRIVARLGERTGGIAAAMTTGQEAWLNPD